MKRKRYLLAVLRSIGRGWCKQKKPSINEGSLIIIFNKCKKAYFPLALAWSAKNVAKPLSVNGCFNNAVMAESGAVITSAPNLAQATMCNGPRIEAANI